MVNGTSLELYTYPANSLAARCLGESWGVLLALLTLPRGVSVLPGTPTPSPYKHSISLISFPFDLLGRNGGTGDGTLPLLPPPQPRLPRPPRPPRPPPTSFGGGINGGDMEVGDVDEVGFRGGGRIMDEISLPFGRDGG